MDYYLPSISDNPRLRGHIHISDIIPRVEALGFTVFGYNPILIFNSDKYQMIIKVCKDGRMVFELEGVSSNHTINKIPLKGKSELERILDILEEDSSLLDKCIRIGQVAGTVKAIEA